MHIINNNKNSQQNKEPEALIKKSISLGGKTFIYYRPSSARKIPLKTTSNRGFMPSIKPHLNKVILEYESQLERDFLILLDHDPNCIDLQTQPVELSYNTKLGRQAKIYPDCWGLFSDGREYLFDVKAEEQLEKLISDENWRRRTEAVQEFCKKMNWKYQVITEKKIKCVRLDNIKDLLAAAKHYSLTKINRNIETFNTNLKKHLKTPKKFRELAKLLNLFTQLTLEEIYSLLKYKIYFNMLKIDWNKPLEETLITFEGENPSPIYSLTERSTIETESNISINNNKGRIFSVKDMKDYRERLELITPLINKFGNEAVRRDILKYCEVNNQPFYRTYKYYLLYKKEGTDGLIPRRNKKHNKSHLDERVETLLQESIYEWNHGEWQQIKAAYEEFSVKCHKLGLKPASYQTFRLRINSLPAVEIKGKFKPKTQSFISRGLNNTYSEGRYPGAVIQMDHTLLDIWLVDSFTKKAIGRPWLTLAIDVFSRSFWGFFLSFETPSQESITQAIISGLTPKERLCEWNIFESKLIKEGLNPYHYKYPCAGFPSIIQVDNGRDFRANLVKEFCMDLNITLEFRPIRTPEYGGFVESVWDTINDYIRGVKLPGRVFSLPKSRKSVKKPKFQAPPGYDPKKEAALTYDDFREVFFGFLVLRYSTEPKAHQIHSPNELWIDGLRGEKFQPMGGALRVLNSSEYNEFNFKAKITTSSVLSQKGFRYKNILYSSVWLREARKNKILEDGKRYDFKVSHWDIRYAHIINPINNEIEILEAYNYDGDDRLTNFILKGLGKKSGYKNFTISLNMIKTIKKILGKSQGNINDNLLIIDNINKKMFNKAKSNKKEQKLLEDLSKTKKGREKINAAKIIAQMDDEPIIIPRQEEESIFGKEAIDEMDDEEIIGYPTEWEVVKKEMNLLYFDEEEEDDI